MTVVMIAIDSNVEDGQYTEFSTIVYASVHGVNSTLFVWALHQLFPAIQSPISFVMLTNHS